MCMCVREDLHVRALVGARAGARACARAGARMRLRTCLYVRDRMYVCAYAYAYASTRV